MASLLFRNIGICNSPNKASHFFDSDEIWMQGMSYYRNAYSACADGLLKVDATPIFGIGKSLERFQQTFDATKIKSVKFILILREPVAREFSLYQHHIRECKEYLNNPGSVKSVDFATSSCHSVILGGYIANKSLAEFSAVSFREYVTAGNVHKRSSDYAYQLKRWLGVIDRSQLFIVNLRTLIENATDTMNRLQSFLGLAAGWGNNVTFPHENKSQYLGSALDCHTFDALKHHFDRTQAELHHILHSRLRSPNEPVFPHFDNTRKRCTDMTQEPDMKIKASDLGPGISGAGIRSSGSGVVHRQMKPFTLISGN